MAKKIGGLSRGRGLESLIPSAQSSVKPDKKTVKPKLISAAERAAKFDPGTEVREQTTLSSDTGAEASSKAEPEVTKKAASSADNSVVSHQAVDKSAVKKADIAEDTAENENSTSKNKESALSDNKKNAAPESKPLKKKQQVNYSPSGSIILPLNSIYPNSRQPRRSFDDESIAELADSINEHGLIQPLVVKPVGKYYEIIAGERRWRACKEAGIKEVPVVIREFDDQETLEVSIIENIQRENLKPLDEANAYRRLAEEFGLTQEEIAKKVSKSRAAVANSMRLLNLDPSVGSMLNDGIISSGHARAILSIENPQLQSTAAKQVIAKGLSVRETEKLVKKLKMPAPAAPQPKDDAQLDSVYKGVEEKLKASLGTKVSIKRKNASSGSIEIEYYSSAELERLIDILNSVKEG